MAEHELGRQPVTVTLYTDEHMVDDDGNRYFAGARIEDDTEHELPFNSVATIEGDHVFFDGDGEDRLRIHRNNVNLEVPDSDIPNDQLWDMIAAYSPNEKVVTYELDDDALEVFERSTDGLGEKMQSRITEVRDDTVRVSIDVANSEYWNDDSQYDWVSIWRVHGVGISDSDLPSVFADEGNVFHSAGLETSVEDGMVVFQETVSQSPPHGTITYRVPVEDVEVTEWDNYRDESDIPDEELGTHLLE
jgi:hypothetical protein